MKLRSPIQLLLTFMVCLLIVLFQNSEASACEKKHKRLRSVASSKSTHAMKKTMSKSKKKMKISKHRKASHRRIIAPARVRIIDTGKKLGPDNFPIPDVDKIAAQNQTGAYPDPEINSETAELSSHLPSDNGFETN